MLLSCQSLPVSLAMPTNLIRRVLLLLLIINIIIVFPYVEPWQYYLMMSLWWQEVMEGLMVTHKQIWWDKESFNTTYNNTTCPLLNIYTIVLSHSCYTELAESLIFLNMCGLEMDPRCYYLIHCLYCLRLEDCLVTPVALVTIIEL